MAKEEYNCRAWTVVCRCYVLSGYYFAMSYALTDKEQAFLYLFFLFLFFLLLSKFISSPNDLPRPYTEAIPALLETPSSLPTNNALPKRLILWGKLLLPPSSTNCWESKAFWYQSLYYISPCKLFLISLEGVSLTKECPPDKKFVLLFLIFKLTLLSKVKRDMTNVWTWHSDFL